MLYLLLFPLSEHFNAFNVFRYITFRSGGAVVTSLLISFIFGPSLIAWLRDKPALLEYVRRNLDVTLYLLEPNGEVDTTASRRQDQKGGREVWWYLTQFRELALHTGDGRFTTVAKSIESRGTGELGDFLAEVLERPELSATLPAAAAAPTNFVQHYPSQASVRIRRDDRTATIRCVD